MSPAYGWLITDTRFLDEAPGACGPAGTPFAPERIEREGRVFRLLDHAGNLYYEGRYLGPEDEQAMAGPLDDFGSPHAGATTIEYRAASGAWEPL